MLLLLLLCSSTLLKESALQGVSYFKNMFLSFSLYMQEWPFIYTSSHDHFGNMSVVKQQ